MNDEIPTEIDGKLHIIWGHKHMNNKHTHTHMHTRIHHSSTQKQITEYQIDRQKHMYLHGLENYFDTLSNDRKSFTLCICHNT